MAAFKNTQLLNKYHKQIKKTFSFRGQKTKHEGRHKNISNLNYLYQKIFLYIKHELMEHLIAQKRYALIYTNLWFIK